MSETDFNIPSGKPFLVLGRAGMDFYADPPGTELERGTHFTSALGGSAGNTAAGIARLGGQAALVTCVSDDAVGRYILNQLADYGVDSCHVMPVAGEFRSSLAVVESRLENCQSVIYRNGAADFQMNTSQVSAIDYDQYGALVFSGTALACEPSRAATFKALELARAAGLRIVLDIDYRPYSWPSNEEAAEVCNKAALLCDMVVGNDVEFGVLAGAIEKGFALAESLAANTAAWAIYKMGEKGSTTLSSTRSFNTGIYRVAALKPTGAGDAFMAGLLSFLAAGRTMEQSVFAGSATAAIVVSRVGCAPAMPTLSELENFMSEQTPED